MLAQAELVVKASVRLGRTLRESPPKNRFQRLLRRYAVIQRAQGEFA